jgi:hypothetical protein
MRLEIGAQSLVDSYYTHKRDIAFLVTRHLHNGVRMLMSVHHTEDAAIEAASKLFQETPHLFYGVHIATFDPSIPLTEISQPRHAKETELEL